MLFKVPSLLLKQLYTFGSLANTTGGVRFSGIWPEADLVEIIELVDHPWFLGCQFHPDIKSRPLRPHPLFRDFVRAAA